MLGKRVRVALNVGINSDVSVGSGVTIALGDTRAVGILETFVAPPAHAESKIEKAIKKPKIFLIIPPI